MVTSVSSHRIGPTIVIPTTTNWDVKREGGTESFIRNLAREGSQRGVPIQILSTGGNRCMDGSVEVKPIIGRARSELSYVRALRRKLKSRELSLPAEALVLANAEHYVWPFMDTSGPVLMIAHGAVAPTLRTTRGLLKTLLFETMLEGRAVARASRIAAVSERTGAYYLKKFPRARSKIIQLPFGINLDDLPLPGTPPRIDRWELGPDRFTKACPRFFWRPFPSAFLLYPPMLVGRENSSGHPAESSSEDRRQNSQMASPALRG